MELIFEHTCEAPRNAVFQFHARPTSLAVLSHQRAGFRLLHANDTIRLGAQTWFEQTVWGCIPVALGFRHTLFEPPECFAEELIHGPFEQFVHIHEFEEHGRRTLVRDILRVRLRRVYGGEWATRWIAAPMIRQAFEFRHRALDRLITSGAIAASNG